MARNREKSKAAPTAAPANVKARKRKRAPADETDAASVADPLNQVVTLCQEQRWREALLLCRRGSRDADQPAGGLTAALGGAQAKIEYSLRRQMAAAFIEATKTMLAKEYLLDVGE